MAILRKVSSSAGWDSTGNPGGPSGPPKTSRLVRSSRLMKSARGEPCGVGVGL